MNDRRKKKNGHYSFSMVNRLDNDSSYSSFADYQLDDAALFQHDDDDDSSSSTASVDLSNEIGGIIIGDPPASYNNSHGDDLLDESASVGTSWEELLFPTVDYAKTTTTSPNTNTITTTTTPKTITMPKDRRRPIRKTVRFGSQEIRYFIVLPDGQTHVTKHQVQLLPEEKNLSLTIAEDRWRPFLASSLLMCRRPAPR
jgi:hypothetical protein